MKTSQPQSKLGKPEAPGRRPARITRAQLTETGHLPQTSEAVRFNHAAFFQISTMEPAVRRELSASFDEQALPSNSYYGDGSPIEPATPDEIREAYWQETVAVAWPKGDVLPLDNMLTAHGRAPFEGPRKVLAGMAEPVGADGAGGAAAGEEL